MKVKELIEKLQQLNPEKQVYMGDNELNENTYYYQVLNVVENTVENENLIVITYRK